MAWVAITTLVLTVLAIGWLRPRLLRLGMVDVPDQRRQHVQPTPRGAGLGMALVLCLMLLGLGWIWSFQMSWLASVGVLVVGSSVLGGLDDHMSLGVSVRLLGQVVLALGSLLLMGLALTDGLTWLWALALVWSMNLHNFMDGSDGLAGLQGVWVGVGLAFLFYGQADGPAALVAVMLAGACGGLLVWNWPPARVFMGDSGSLLIGAMVAWLLIWGHANESLPWWLAALWVSVFVIDATATLLLRVLRGERWYTAHHDHAYQRLIAMGATHSQVLWAFAVIKLAVIVPVTIGVQGRHVDPVVAVCGVYALLVLAWLGVQYQAQRRIGWQ